MSVSCPQAPDGGATFGVAFLICAMACFAMLCGWLVFDHVPGLLESLGIALIVCCGVTATWLAARGSQ